MARQPSSYRVLAVIDFDGQVFPDELRKLATEIAEKIADVMKVHVSLGAEDSYGRVVEWQDHDGESVLAGAEH